MNFSTARTPTRIRKQSPTRRQGVRGALAATLRLSLLVVEAAGICPMAYSLGARWVCLLGQGAVLVVRGGGYPSAVEPADCTVDGGDRFGGGCPGGYLSGLVYHLFPARAGAERVFRAVAERAAVAHGVDRIPVYASSIAPDRRGVGFSSSCRTISCAIMRLGSTVTRS